MTAPINLNSLSNEITFSILDHLEPRELVKIQRVSKNLQCVANAKVEEFSKKIGLYKSSLENPLKQPDYFKITQNYVEELIEKVEKFQTCPLEMQRIVRTLKNGAGNVTADNINRLKIGIKARDILVIWEELAAQANHQRHILIANGDNIPDVDLVGPGLANLTTVEELVEKEKEFITWFNASRSLLSCIEVLELDNAQLTDVPKELGSLTNLRFLSLFRNYLTELPKELGSLTNLRFLNLNSNYLTELPKELCALIRLKKLGLQDNKLKKIPKEIGNLTRLRELYLKGNKLTQIPEELWNLVRLEKLYLAENQITKIPEELGNLVHLEELDLHANILTAIPLSLSNLVGLKALHLSGNKLKEIPKELGNLVLLRILYLNGNQITELPKELGNLVLLRMLHLDGNQITELPKELENLTCLQGLYLEKNKLTQIHRELGYLKELKILKLQKNKITEIPAEVCKLNLDSFDISYNQITFLNRQILVHIPHLVTTGNPLILTSRGVKAMPSKRCNFCQELKPHEQIAAIAVGCFGLYLAYWLS